MSKHPEVTQATTLNNVIFNWRQNMLVGWGKPIMERLPGKSQGKGKFCYAIEVGAFSIDKFLVT